ncbi:hypothetical protein [Yersinia bercovieri]|uniref:hypothetical protein n=1 Tax=Yersinia bercovieri TaxID=634 RepID=UPI0011AA5A69|nr:hypothetical protein [Yersinia bercovieri]
MHQISAMRVTKVHHRIDGLLRCKIMVRDVRSLANCRGTEGGDIWWVMGPGSGTGRDARPPGPADYPLINRSFYLVNSR